MEFHAAARLRRRATKPRQDEENSLLLWRGCHHSGDDHHLLLEAEQLRPLPLPLTKSQLLGLISLDLASCSLKVLPHDIYLLRNLRELRVPANNLVDLPSTIMRLYYLKTLDASNNRLRTLPKEIASCRFLVELDLRYNRLRRVPERLGDGLSNLKSLLIGGNFILRLPQSICGMTSLRVLDAHSCRISEFPDFVPHKDFLELEVLDLGKNYLASLPGALGTLPSLRHLDLSGNRHLMELPPTFSQLRALRSLNLKGCSRLFVPPPEVVNQGIEAIKEYMSLPYDSLLKKCAVSLLVRKVGVACRFREDASPSNSGHSKLL